MASEHLPVAMAGEVIASTYEYRSDENGMLADNFTDHSALLKVVTDKARPVPGGNLIVESLFFEENSSAAFVEGYEEIPTTPNQTFTTAHYTWSEAAISLTISEREMLMNTGKQAIHNLLSTRMENADLTIKQFMGRHVYGNGLAFGGRAIRGIQAIISDNGEGRVGGIDAGADGYAWWKNRVYTLGSSNEALSASSLGRYMSSTITDLVRMNDRPDVIVTTKNLWSIFERSMQGQQRQTNSRMADLGFVSLNIHGTDVVFDDFCPAGRMYFINTDYLSLRPHANANFRVVGGKRMPVNQNATIQIMHWMGQMTCRNRHLQGVIKTS